MLHVTKKLFVAALLSLGFISSLSADFYVIPVKMKAANIIKVAKSGGDFSDPVAAVNSISNASATNPYRVVVGSGTYMLSQPLYMKPYVGIIGVGTVTLKGAFGVISTADSAVVHGENNASISNVTIINEGNNSTGNSIAMYNEGASPYLKMVRLVGSGGQWNYGSYNKSASSPVMINVDINATLGEQSIGMKNDASSPIMHRGTVTVSDSSTNANYGIYVSPK